MRKTWVLQDTVAGYEMEVEGKMRMKRRGEKSIASILSRTILVFGSVQMVLLIIFMLVGGILSKIKEQAYESFSERVNARLLFLENEMTEHWKENADAMNHELSEEFSAIMKQNGGVITPYVKQRYLEKSLGTMLATLRSAEVNGVFLILNDGKEGTRPYTAMYLKDNDPKSNVAVYSDVNMMIGPDFVAMKNQISRGTLWQSDLFIEGAKEDFFRVPMEASEAGTKEKLCGYWSGPGRLVKKEESVIIYSIPLIDRSGKARGVTGITLNSSWLKTLLPPSEIDSNYSMGYVMAKGGNEGEEAVYPLILGMEEQGDFLKKEDPMALKLEDAKRGIYQLESTSGHGRIMASLREIGLYGKDSPYREQKWYLAALIKRNGLLIVYNNIVKVLTLSALMSVLIGLGTSVLAGRRFTRPIRELAERVRESDISVHNEYGVSPYTEVNSITSAILQANENFVKSTSKLLEIMNRTNIPIGIFEYSIEGDQVYLSDYLLKLLHQTKEDREKFLKTDFQEYLKEIMEHHVENEKGVYEVSGVKQHYVRIDCIENGTDVIGIVEDVTEEILEKEKIKRERDYDALTKLRNRSSFEKQVRGVISKGGIKKAAMVMFDLDNFKGINDTYGHKCGDAYLFSMGEHLKEAFQKNCIAGRRSGDEFFAFIYRRNSEEEVKKLLAKFYEILEKKPFTFPNRIQNSIRVSAGVTWCTEDNTDYNNLLEEADAALYESKHIGKGIPVLYCGEKAPGEKEYQKLL